MVSEVFVIRDNTATPKNPAVDKSFFEYACRRGETGFIYALD